MTDAKNETVLAPRLESRDIGTYQSDRCRFAGVLAKCTTQSGAERSYPNSAIDVSQSK